MANPQPENGYTVICNEILEAISKTKLNGTQFRIVMVIWRSTYGWNKKEHDISETFLSKATGIHKQQIKRELRSMIDKNILTIVKEATFNTSRVIKFNKNYDMWELNSSEVAKKIPPSEKDTSTGSELDTSTGSELDTQKNNIKNNIKNNEFLDFFELVWKMYPEKKGKGKISEATKRKVYKLGDEFIRCIERYKKDKATSEWKQWQNGSTFFKSGYVDYLDVNHEKVAMQKSESDYKARDEDKDIFGTDY